MTTTKKPGGLTPLAKGLLAATLFATAIGATKHFAPGLFGGGKSTAAPSVPPKAPLRAAEAPVPATAGSTTVATIVPTIAPPTSAKAGCSDRAETRMLIWAWNAQQGLLFANGGSQAVEGSLMCKHGVNLKLIRQDMVDQMQAELIKCAAELGSGHADCTGGAHYVAIMGDGSAAFLAALEPELAKVCADCRAEIVGSAGYSRGEDKFMGPQAWR
ncbi:MAG TPA: hypothetical protein VIV40_34200, partial [Kofleriaceae bacterium]